MPTDDPTVAASLTRAVVDWAAARGLSVADPLADPRRGWEPDRVPQRAHEGVWRAVHEAAPDRLLAVTPSIVRPRAMGVVGGLAMTSGTVGESLARLARYAPILKDGVQARVRVDEGGLAYELWSARPIAPVVAGATLYSLRHLVEAWADVHPSAAWFPHPNPAPGLSYELFGCDTRFGQPALALRFPREAAEAPLHTAQPEVASLLEALARAQLLERERRHDAGVASRVAAVIREDLTADLRLREVARRLHVSERTLQRRLADEGASFRDVLDRVRWSVAAPLVAATSASLDEIAERVGYADTKALRRAFRRWTGAPPSHLRAPRPREDQGTA